MAAVLSYDTDWHQTLATTTPHMAERADRFGENDSLRQNMAANNAHIQAGYFIVAARAAGLAAGPMTGFDAAGVDKEFFAGSSRHAFLVVNLGRPSTDEPRPRLPRLGSEVATETI